MTRWIAAMTLLLSFICQSSSALEENNAISAENFKKAYPTLRYEDAMVEMAKPLDVELNKERYLFTCHVIFGSDSKDEYVRFYSVFRYDNSRWLEIKRNIVNIWDASTYYPNSMPSIELIGFRGQKYVAYQARQRRGSSIALFEVMGGRVIEMSWDEKSAIDMVGKKLRNDEEIGLIRGDPVFKDTEITETFFIMDKAYNCTGCKPVAEVVITFDIIGGEVTPIRAERKDVRAYSDSGRIPSN